MASIKIGNIVRLDPRNVSDNAITVLATRLQAPPSGFLVPCCLCGTERHHRTLIDPGQIVYERFTCQTVNKTCCSIRAKPALAGYSLVPGSLVLALHDPAHGRFWPAIVEDSPDHFPRHIATVHRGEDRSPITAYYVTFINAESWLGGWIRADSLLPFSNRFQSHVNSKVEGLKFCEAVRVCDAALKLSLRERLLLHSFVAFVALQRGIPLPNNKILKETIGTQIMFGGGCDPGADDEMDWENSQPFWFF